MEWHVPPPPPLSLYTGHIQAEAAELSDGAKRSSVMFGKTLRKHLHLDLFSKPFLESCHKWGHTVHKSESKRNLCIRNRSEKFTCTWNWIGLNAIRSWYPGLIWSSELNLVVCDLEECRGMYFFYIEGCQWVNLRACIELQKYGWLCYCSFPLSWLEEEAEHGYCVPLMPTHPPAGGLSTFWVGIDVPLATPKRTHLNTRLNRDYMLARRP